MMNIFDQKLQDTGNYPLKALKFKTLEANVGYRCNLRCTHCYVESSPERTEEMSKDIIEKILNILKNNKEIEHVDITGGAPEMNTHFRYFIRSAAGLGKKVIVRSNLAIWSEPGYEDTPEFLAENRAKVVASLPCVTEDGVDRQRGKGTYNKAIAALKKLNALGYGKEDGELEIDIVFNPGRAAMAPEKTMLEKVYREKLLEMHSITFNNLIVLHNAPVGRLRNTVSEDDIAAYEKELQDKFNPAAVNGCMCRHIINVSHDGTLHDCDCTQMLKRPLKDGSLTLDNFDYEKLSTREISTMPVCFICTAGAGTSCLPDNASAECGTQAKSCCH